LPRVATLEKGRQGYFTGSFTGLCTPFFAPFCPGSNPGGDTKRKEGKGTSQGPSPGLCTLFFAVFCPGSNPGGDTRERKARVLHRVLHVLPFSSPPPRSQLFHRSYSNKQSTQKSSEEPEQLQLASESSC